MQTIGRPGIQYAGRDVAVQLHEEIEFEDDGDGDQVLWRAQ